VNAYDESLGPYDTNIESAGCGGCDRLERDVIKLETENATLRAALADGLKIIDERDRMRAELKKFEHEMQVPSASHLQLRTWVVEWHERVKSLLAGATS
jgi:hypothetical protein